MCVVSFYLKNLELFRWIGVRKFSSIFTNLFIRVALFINGLYIAFIFINQSDEIEIQKKYERNNKNPGRLS